MSAEAAESAIRRLLFDYARRMDAGDLAGVAQLFDGAQLRSSVATQTGAEEALAHLTRTTRLFADGTPRTRHVTTNVVVDVDEVNATASASSYVTVFQKSEDDQALRPIFAGRYADRFARSGGSWHFTERTKISDLVGDLSHHLTTRELGGTAALAGLSSLEPTLRQVLYRLARCIDRGEWDGAAACFTPEARVGRGEDADLPVDAYLAALRADSDTTIATRREISMVVVTATAHDVTTEAYSTETSWVASPDGTDEIVVRGRYLDRWLPGRDWLIDQRLVRSDTRTVNGRPRLTTDGS